MPGLIASGLNGWTYGGSILTFAFPELLFIAVAATLYVLFTKPHVVPGHRYHLNGGPVTSTPSGNAAEAGGDAAKAAEGK